MGALGWDPHVFWRATPRDLSAALRGRAPRKTVAGGLTGEDVRHLKEMLENERH